MVEAEADELSTILKKFFFVHHEIEMCDVLSSFYIIIAVSCCKFLLLSIMDMQYSNCDSVRGTCMIYQRYPYTAYTVANGYP